MVIAHLKSTDGTAAFSRDRHFGGVITLDSRDEPIGNGNASAFWYKPVIQFGFGVIEYTTSGFALGRVYSITPHPHCITYTYLPIVTMLSESRA